MRSHMNDVEPDSLFLTDRSVRAVPLSSSGYGSGSCLNVGLVTHHVVRGEGEGRVMVELTRAMVERGHHVTVYAWTLAPELSTEVDFRQLPRFVGRAMIDDPVMFANATAVLRRSRHDVVCVMGVSALPSSPFVY